MSETNSSCLLTVSLIQQTPLIHFQHDQIGATLRATEVKPKLDRFLREKYGEKNIPDDWFVKGDRTTGALNYKLRFHAMGKPERSRAGEYAIAAFEAETRGDLQEKKEQERKMRSEINGMYFANMVTKKEQVSHGHPRRKTNAQYAEEVRQQYKETVFSATPIIMTVLCMHSDLRKLIEEHLSEFFLTHNFGTRQSKGFGGFSVQLQQPEDPVAKLRKAGYLFFWTNTGRCAPQDCLNHAMTVYAILKGGLNLTNGNPDSPRYIKSYVQREFLDEWIRDQKIGSDKALVKSYVLDWNVTDPDGSHVYEDGYTFIRALLGLADHYEYHKTIEATVTIHPGDLKEEIQRFPSPITVKIVDGKLIFLLDTEAIQPILDRRFFFLTKEQENSLPRFNSPEEKLAYLEEHYPNNWICTPKQFSKKDAYALLSGFVRYFNDKRFKLEKFSAPHKASNALELKMGGN